MDDENGGLLGQVKNLATIGKYTRYLEDSQSILANWGKFAFLFLFGCIILVMSLPFSSFLLINPKPFCMLFSLGSAVILMSLFQVTQPMQILKQAMVPSGIYAISLILSLYAGLVYIGYFYTLGVLLAQIGSLFYIMVSQFPGGKVGLHMVANQAKNAIVGGITRIFSSQSNKPYLPL